MIQPVCFAFFEGKDRFYSFFKEFSPYSLISSYAQNLWWPSAKRPFSDLDAVFSPNLRLTAENMPSARAASYSVAILAWPSFVPFVPVVPHLPSTMLASVVPIRRCVLPYLDALFRYGGEVVHCYGSLRTPFHNNVPKIPEEGRMEKDCCWSSLGLWGR